MIDRPRRWLRERPTLLDPAVAVMCFVLTAPMTVMIAYQRNVAHHMPLVNAQAGVAHPLMKTDPGHAYEALGRIRDTSRVALDELRATVGLLRNGDDQDASRQPAPGLADLAGLLATFRHAGLA